MTAQVGERLILDGTTVEMTSCPELPLRNKRLVKRAPEDPAVPGIAFSTACWRRYIGTWRIDGDRLYLVAVAGDYRLVGDEPLFADWVSEKLVVPRGRMIEYVHMGFASRFESETWIWINHGCVTKREEFGEEDMREIEKMIAGVDRRSEQEAWSAWRLEVIDGPGTGATLKVGYGLQSVGRRLSNRLALPFGDCDMALRDHMFIVLDGQKDILFATRGENKLTRVNDMVVLAPIELKPGDVICLGTTTLKVTRV